MAGGAVVGIENGAGYGQLLCSSLAAAGHEVLNVPAWRTKRDRGRHGPGKSDPVDVVATRPHEGGVAGENDGDAEHIAFSAVARGQLRLLGPDPSGAHEDPGGALVAPAGDVTPERSYESGVAGERGRQVEVVTNGAVACRELRLLDGEQRQRIEHRALRRRGDSRSGDRRRNTEECREGEQSEQRRRSRVPAAKTREW